ncbi:MAG: amidase, partial [Christensenella sp.]
MKLVSMGAKQAAELLQKKEISSAELTNACIERTMAVEPKISALVTLCAEEALAAAKRVDEKRAQGKPLGRLAGIPTIIKDNMCTKGVLSTASSKMLFNYKPVYDATVIEKLKAEDYVMLGKANMDEFAMGSSTETSYFGATKNPWDTSRVPGGSSGGSAACVAADEAMFALGSDTGGSVRQPAAFCGVVGLKPTYGTVSRFGLMAFASSLDQIGPLTKNVEDSAFIMNIIAGNDKKDSTSAIMEYPHYGEGMKRDIKGMKVGIPKEYSEQKIDAEVRQYYTDAIKKFEDMGAI